MMNFFMGAITLGVMMVVVGTIVGYFIGKLFSVNLPKICKDWNKNHVMEISLFVTGFSVFLLCEFTGLSKWYCKSLKK